MHSESTPRAISRNQSAISMHSECTPRAISRNQPQSERNQHALRVHSAPIDHSEVEGEYGAEFK